MRRSVAPGSKISQLPGIANLTRVGGGVSFSTKVSLGQETYDMIVDTGSSDTWVASKTLQCTYFGIEVSQAFCKFGPLYDRQTFKKIQGQNFRIQYGDGTEATGDMGYDSVTLGGINVPSQEIAVVERAFWQGDSVTSGLLGFSYPSITSAYNGTDPSKDQHRKNQLPYDPLLTTMYKQGSINPVFSLAINRGANNEPAGVLALGGIPSEFQSLTYARTPIARTNFLNEDEPSAAIPSKYEFYALYPEAFLYGPPSSKNTSTMPDPTTLTNDTRRLIHIVDSGTTLNILPQPLAANIAAAYTPPAISPSGGIYVLLIAV
ncbi:putative aspartic-type endopeptidase [Glarea lozoyensis 74030]|uniref:Putative aspartic-type endopeptidase n=1 Tax=Glarea lozoyensis (strain ATCC 74030 / MF5533) TaxID=1104152 RepID=H0EH38_GLAL7|nr:putative aspartic-type endopeptidase [Glarea lozoyensis 74030]